MSQYEYVFVAISIILGLAITRLLHTVATLIRVHQRVVFHWSTALWGLSVMVYILQLWWVGWGLHDLAAWSFSDFLVLVFGSICIYGAADMALPVPEEASLDMLQHSQNLGRLSALSMLLYFVIGPYVNLVMFENPALPAILLPLCGVALMAMAIFMRQYFPWISVVFALYSAGILYLTA